MISFQITLFVLYINPIKLQLNQRLHNKEIKWTDQNIFFENTQGPCHNIYINLT
jgi:hypothetical protein